MSQPELPCIIQEPTVSPGWTRAVKQAPRFALWLSLPCEEVIVRYSHLFPSSVLHSVFREMYLLFWISPGILRYRLVGL